MHTVLISIYFGKRLITNYCHLNNSILNWPILHRQTVTSLHLFKQFFFLILFKTMVMTPLMKVLFGFILSSLKECLSWVSCICAVNLKISSSQKKKHRAKIQTTLFRLNFLSHSADKPLLFTYLNLGWSTAIQFYGHEDCWSLVLLYKTLQYSSAARLALSIRLPLAPVVDLDFEDWS